jgi:hypothetical protein
MLLVDGSPRRRRPDVHEPMDRAPPGLIGRRLKDLRHEPARMQCARNGSRRGQPRVSLSMQTTLSPSREGSSAAAIRLCEPARLNTESRSDSQRWLLRGTPRAKARAHCPQTSYRATGRTSSEHFSNTAAANRGQFQLRDPNRLQAKYARSDSLIRPDSGCGPGGRRFESGRSPSKETAANCEVRCHADGSPKREWAPSGHQLG